VGPSRLPPVRKSLGQHFLSDRRILGRIVDALDPKPGETVVEIGPGRGGLTELLSERAHRVVAIEVDRALAAMLRDKYAGTNVEIVEADVLGTNLHNVAGGDYALVGNVPYNITTPILFHALRRPRANRMVFLLQREVADRMSASPGGKEYGALTVNLQGIASVETQFRVAPGSFQPPPKVESAVVRIVPLDEPLIEAGEEERFRTAVQGMFGMRRKQMRRVVRSLFNLDVERAEDVLRRAGIDPEARPETLSPADFARLLRLVPSP
jgi:16S rRNA (adenine1518-N6/adenine1519-N6)-dimethyltransferase